jgi:hypothetical protein
MVFRYGFAFLLCLVSAPAMAYIGPGVGAGAFAVLVGTVCAIVFAIAGLIYYPLKGLFRKLRRLRKPGK